MDLCHANAPSVSDADVGAEIVEPSRFAQGFLQCGGHAYYAFIFQDSLMLV